MKHKIILIPELDACDFTNEVENELIDNDIGIHYQSDGVGVDWDDSYNLPIFKNWLVGFYGKKIKQYRNFSISAT